MPYQVKETVHFALNYSSFTLGEIFLIISNTVFIIQNAGNWEKCQKITAISNIFDNIWYYYFFERKILAL